MLPFDSPSGWRYEDDGSPTVPMARNPSSLPADQEDFFSLQKGNRPQRRGWRLPLILVLVMLLALAAGVATNVLGIGTSLSRVLIHLAQAQSNAPRSAVLTPMPGTVQKISGANAPMPMPQLSQTLPAEWAASGHTAADAADAAVIAQGFTERYESIEGNTQQSLAESLVLAELFMSRNAQLRYQGKIAGIAPDPHFTRAFANQFQMGTLSQQAIPDGIPQMLPPERSNGTFYALIIVPYQKMVTLQSRVVQTTQERMAVALVAVAKNGQSIPNTMGWAIVAYKPGTTPPPLPMQP